ncbi:MAG: helix-turn-helix domain-containing protein [Bacilli bacterium]
MSDEANGEGYVRAKKYPIQEKAEQEVISALLKAGVRGGDMDAVLDAMDKHIDAELWVMGYLLRKELVDMGCRLRKEGVYWEPFDLRLRQVIMLAGLRAERTRHVTIEEGRLYLSLRDLGLSYREVAYVVGRSTETVHRGTQTTEEYLARNGRSIDDEWEDGWAGVWGDEEAATGEGEAFITKQTPCSSTGE